jgi:hypothetical protein
LLLLLLLLLQQLLLRCQGHKHGFACKREREDWVCCVSVFMCV